MIVTMLILLQSSIPASVEEAKPYSPRGTHIVCPRQDEAGGDIVVCGHVDANEQYRLKPLTHQYDPVAGPGIGMRVGAGQANLYAAQQASPDGKPDKRIMVTLKLPF